MPPQAQPAGSDGKQAPHIRWAAVEPKQRTWRARCAAPPLRDGLLLAADAAAACAAWCRSAGAGPPALQGLDLLLRMREMSQMPAQGPGRVSWPKALLAGFAGSLARYEAGRRRCAGSSADAPPGAHLSLDRPPYQGAATPAQSSWPSILVNTCCRRRPERRKAQHGGHRRVQAAQCRTAPARASAQHSVAAFSELASRCRFAPPPTIYAMLLLTECLMCHCSLSL